MLIALVIVIIVVAAVLLVAAKRPDRFRIERSAVIHASPEHIFPFINELHRWQAWSPYEKKDPAMQRSFEGPASGIPGPEQGLGRVPEVGLGVVATSALPIG